MHEQAVLRDLIREMQRVTAQHGARRVLAAHVWLGALCHLDEGHFREHFAIESRGTCAAGAAVTVEVSDDLSAPSAQGVILRSVELADD
jgi:Zn finger protein HypA/HybF involved in hydrogenase expression